MSHKKTLTQSSSAPGFFHCSVFEGCVAFPEIFNYNRVYYIYQSNKNNSPAQGRSVLSIKFENKIVRLPGAEPSFTH